MPSVIHPPSPKYVREVLLPALAVFFAPERVMPSEEEWAEALRAVRVVLGGPGGRRFLGTQEWEAVMVQVERS
jgi:hypothetical protein